MVQRFYGYLLVTSSLIEEEVLMTYTWPSYTVF